MTIDHNLLTVRTQLVNTDGSGPDYNVHHIEAIGTDLSVSANAFIADLTTFYTAIKGLYRTGVSISVGNSAQTVVKPPLIVSTVPQIVAGTGATPGGPPEMSLVLTWRTAIAGRSYRGRSYIGPLSTTVTSQPVPQAANITTLQNAANALVAASKASLNYTMVVFSPHLTDVQNVLSATARNYYGHQRRRR